MKVIILAAWWNSIKLWWPIFSKPKTLYHKDWEIVIIRLLKNIIKAWFKQEDIILVVGYKWNMFLSVLKKYWFDKIEVRYNKDRKKSVISSVKIWIEWINEDVLIICADLLVSSESIRKFKESKSELVCVRLNKIWTDNNDILNDLWYDIVKIWKNKVKELDKLSYYWFFIKEKCKNKFGNISEWWWVFFSISFKWFFYKNKIYTSIKLKDYNDFDMYYETDEYKKNKFKIFTITWWWLLIKNFLKKINIIKWKK